MFHQNGIIHRASCSYTPQQNGTAERKHRHIVEVGLALLSQSSLSLSFWDNAFVTIFWDDAFLTAVFIINRLPYVVLDYKTPLELLYNHKPNYTRLRAFRCLCFPHLRPYIRHKLEFRSCSGTFLGYNTQHKCYKVLFPSGKVIVSKYVIFNEDVFPHVENSGTPPLVATLHDPCPSIGPPIVPIPSPNLSNSTTPLSPPHTSFSDYPPSDQSLNSSHETILLVVELLCVTDNMLFQMIMLLNMCKIHIL